MNRKHVNKGWCTKNDVMEDLALATGDVGGLEVDEHCLVYGERPPPRPVCDIDDDMKILFGGRAGEIDGNHQFAEPDLKGIMSMIRMVETEDDDYSPKSKPTDVIVISKLNPNVREFVPKSQTVPETMKNKTWTRPKANDNVVEETTARNTTNNNVVQEITLNPKTNNNVVQGTTASRTTKDEVVQVTTPSPSPNNIDVQRATPSPITERKHITKPAKICNTPTPTQSSTTEAEIQSLKDIIVNTKDSYQHRREKNAAIATLLRHCTTPPIKKEVKEKPIKLYTPEFFERCKAEDFKGTDDEVDETEELNKDTTSQETDPIDVDVPAGDEHTNLTQDVANDLNLDNTKMQEFYDEKIEQNKLIVKIPETGYKDTEQKNMIVKLPEPSYEKTKEKNLIVNLPEPSYGKAKENNLIVNLPEPSYEKAKEKKLIVNIPEPSYEKAKENNLIVNLPEPTKDEMEQNESVSKVPEATYEELQQKNSIAKVQEWLNGPSLPKKPISKPVVLAGSIAYKRKEVMSPTSTSSTTVDKKISKQDDKAFVPSTYAKELRQKYEKNKKEANKALNIWDNLEQQLKEKDEEIRRKKAGQDQ